MRTTRPTAIAAIAALLSGCATTLDVRSDSNQRSYTEGVVQVLPFTQYEVEAVWQLVACDKGAENVALSVSAEPTQQDDPGQHYLIDPVSLQQPLTRSSFSVSYFEGSNTIKAVNAEVEDRTVEFAANVVTTVAKVAGALTGVPFAAHSMDSGVGPPSPPPPPPPPPPVECTDSARQALADLAALDTALGTANELVAAANQEVTRLTTVAGLVWEVNADMAKELTAALKRQDDAITAQAKAKKKLEKALEAVTVGVAIRWPENGNQYDRDPLTVPESALESWFKYPTSPDQWPQSFLAIRPSVGSRPEGATSGPPSRVRGIPYRLNALGRLVTCEEQCAAHKPDGETLVEGNVAQLGGVRILPVRNPALASTTFSAEFNRDGTLVSGGTAQTVAPGEAASAMVANAATNLAPLFDPVERMKRQTAYYEAVKERNAARDALRPAPAADPVVAASATFQARTTLLDSERLMIEAEAARDQALAARANQN